MISLHSETQLIDQLIQQNTNENFAVFLRWHFFVRISVLGRIWLFYWVPTSYVMVSPFTCSVRSDCSFCWHWGNCLPSLFTRSFHNIAEING